MDSICRGLFIYFFLLLILRIAGKRTLSQMTTFDLVLLLIISETTQEAMIDGDHSIINAVLLIGTLVGTSILLSFIKMKFPNVDKWLDDLPMIVINKGNPDKGALERLRIDFGDILSAGRLQWGLERLDQIEYAVVEQNGEITIVPRGDMLRSSARGSQRSSDL